MVQVRSVPEYVHQDCVKLIGNGGAHKQSGTLKPLSILNTGSITTFLPTSWFCLSTCLKWKTFKEVNETVKKIFSQKCLLPDVIKWGCKKINKKKNFFCDKLFLRKYLCVPQELFVLLWFYVGLIVICWF